MDFNEETLQHARGKISEIISSTGRSTKVIYHHKSINELLKEATRGALGRGTGQFLDVDFIYCAGLFDYLSDKICIRLLQLFNTWVNEGGLIVSTNVTPRNPVRYFLEHLLEWNLIYRDENDMLRLAGDLGQSQADCEATGVNVFLETRKPCKGNQ